MPAQEIPGITVREFRLILSGCGRETGVRFAVGNAGVSGMLMDACQVVVDLANQERGRWVRVSIVQCPNEFCRFRDWIVALSRRIPCWSGDRYEYHRYITHALFPPAPLLSRLIA